MVDRLGQAVCDEREHRLKAGLTGALQERAPPTSRASTGMSSSSVAEPSNSVHRLVRIVGHAAGTRAPESTKITGRARPADLFSAFAKLGS